MFLTYKHQPIIRISEILAVNEDSDLQHIVFRINCGTLTSSKKIIWKFETRVQMFEAFEFVSKQLETKTDNVVHNHYHYTQNPLASINPWVNTTGKE